MAQPNHMWRRRQERSRRHSVPTSVLFAAAVVASVLTAGAIPGRAAGFTAFSMAPSSGPPGTTVHVSGGGCSPGLVALPGEDYVELAATSLMPSTVHVPVAPNGSWSGTFTVNALALPGPVAVAPVCVTNNIPSLTTIYSPQVFTVTAPAQAPPAPTSTAPADGSGGPPTTVAPGGGSGSSGGNSSGGGGSGGGNGSGGGSNSGTTIASTGPGTGGGTGTGTSDGGGSGTSGGGGQGAGTSGASTGGVGVAGAKPGTSGAADAAGLTSASTSSNPSHSGGSIAGPIWLLLAGLALLTLLAWVDWKRRRHALEDDPEIA